MADRVVERDTGMQGLGQECANLDRADADCYFLGGLLDVIDPVNPDAGVQDWLLDRAILDRAGLADSIASGLGDRLKAGRRVRSARTFE